MGPPSLPSSPRSFGKQVANLRRGEAFAAAAAAEKKKEAVGEWHRAKEEREEEKDLSLFLRKKRDGGRKVRERDRDRAIKKECKDTRRTTRIDRIAAPAEKEIESQIKKMKEINELEIEFLSSPDLSSALFSSSPRQTFSSSSFRFVNLAATASSSSSSSSSSSCSSCCHSRCLFLCSIAQVEKFLTPPMSSSSPFAAAFSLSFPSPAAESLRQHLAPLLPSPPLASSSSFSSGKAHESRDT